MAVLASAADLIFVRFFADDSGVLIKLLVRLRAPVPHIISIAIIREGVEIVDVGHTLAQFFL